MNFKYFTKQKIALESIDSGRTILSVVPPEFTSNEVHSYPVTGMTGGAFPSRSSKAPSPMIKQGLAPSAPSLRFDHRVLFLFTAFAIGDYSIIFFPSCQGLYTPLPPQTPAPLLFHGKHSKPAPIHRKTSPEARSFGVCCVCFRREKSALGVTPLLIVLYERFLTKS